MKVCAAPRGALEVSISHASCRKDKKVLFLSVFFFCFFSGDLKNEEKVLDWLIHQVESDEIEDVTDEMLDMLIEKSPSLAAFFCEFKDV